ncbi:hypothetical protein D3C78_1246950 [compost metagenome]
MDSAGHHLLAGTGLPQDQHVGIGLRDLADEATHRLDPLALAHQQSQQGLPLVVLLLARVQGDEGLAEMQLASQGLVSEGLVRAADEVAVGVIGLYQGEKRDAGEGGQQFSERTFHQLTGQDPLQRTGRFDGHIEFGFYHLLPGDPHEREHSTQLLTSPFIGIDKQYPHRHHIHLSYHLKPSCCFSVLIIIIFSVCCYFRADRDRHARHVRRTKCQNYGALSKAVAIDSCRRDDDHNQTIFVIEEAKIGGNRENRRGRTPTAAGANQRISV